MLKKAYQSLGLENMVDNLMRISVFSVLSGLGYAGNAVEIAFLVVFWYFLFCSHPEPGSVEA